MKQRAPPSVRTAALAIESRTSIQLTINNYQLSIVIFSTGWEGFGSSRSRPYSSISSSAADSAHRDESLAVFDLLEEIHKALTCMKGETFVEFDLVSSTTSHNHEDIIENIESYRCVAIKSLR